MASAYSIARTYNEFVEPMNLDLFAKTLAHKQQQYDVNYARMQEQIHALASLPIVKKADQAYAAERVKQVVDGLNSYGTIDLSSSSVARQVGNHVNQILDDNVKNAVSSTQKYMKHISSMEELKKTKDGRELYDPVNESYALRGFMEYMNNDNVGESLGDISYMPHRNVNEKMNKTLMEAFKMYGVTEEQMQTTDPWTYLETKVQGIQQEKIRAMVNANLDASDRQQLAINGWYNNGLSTPEKAKEVLGEYVGLRNKEIDKVISSIEKSKAKLSSADKKQADEAINNLNSQRSMYTDMLSNKDISPEQVGAFMELEKMVGGFQHIYGERVTSRKYTANQAYANRVRHDLAVEKFIFEKDKFVTEQGQKGFDAFGNLLPTVGTSALTEDTDASTKDLYKPFETLMTDIRGLEESVNGFKDVDFVGTETTEEKIEKIAEKHPAEAKALKKQKDLQDEKINKIRPVVDNLLEGYEKSVGRNNVLGEIKRQYDGASDEGKKMLEYVFEHAKKEYLKLPHSAETSQRLYKPGADFTDPSTYTGLGHTQDTELKNVRPYERKKEAHVKSRTSSIKFTPFSNKTVIELTGGEKIQTKEKFKEYLKGSDADWDFLQSDRTYEEKSKKLAELQEPVTRNYYRSKYPTATEDDVSVLISGGEWTKPNSEKSLAHSKTLDRLEKDKKDPTRFILKSVAESLHDETLLSGRVISNDKRAIEAEKQLHFTLSQFLISKAINKTKIFDPDADIEIRMTPDRQSVTLTTYNTKEAKYFTTDAIAISETPELLQNYIGGQTQKINVIRESSATMSDTEEVQSQKASAYKMLKGVYDKAGQEDKIKKLDIKLVENIVDNPTNYKYVIKDKQLHIAEASNASNIVYTFKNRAENEEQLSAMYTEYLYTSVPVVMMLGEILEAIRQGSIPKTLTK